MKINFEIDYRVSWGQTVCICGSVAELGQWNESKALRLTCYGFSKWKASIEISGSTEHIHYYYLIKEGDTIVSKEWGEPRCQILKGEFDFTILDLWKDAPKFNFLYSAPFKNSFARHNFNNQAPSFAHNTVMLKVLCPHVQQHQKLVICGESDLLGNWQPDKAVAFNPVSFDTWQLVLDASSINSRLEYKLAIYDITLKKISHWEVGDNRTMHPYLPDSEVESVQVINLNYNYGAINWKGAGVAIPVFSLRSEDSFGVGDFSDLNLITDWAQATGQKVIQILPINDTTASYTWTDSYPYNSISIYALHPIYLGLKGYPLSDNAKHTKYCAEAKMLNELPELDYEKVMALKLDYLDDLFAEMGETIFVSEAYRQFYAGNEYWLFSYACFCYFRDIYQTADFSYWGDACIYNKEKLNEAIQFDENMRQMVAKTYFTQYLLHNQLSEAKNYAHQKGVVLKGDIPIGISRCSVEAWVEPHLFNTDSQTGAPPDDFSINGQNWGFPTYNWDEMAKDGYQWWIRRFKKMNDYFDAYRIDHILGFFRIWEIPADSVQGLLGHFSPALPYSEDEIKNNGMWFDTERMTQPYIHEHFLRQYFGEYVNEVIENYLDAASWQRFRLKEICNSQLKIKNLFDGKEDVRNSRIKSGLYKLCNEVLFVRDKQEPDKLHPRISAQNTHSYNDLDQPTKQAFDALYEEFFYHRHNQFWHNQAMKKLPKLIAATDMLVCGEDLGMIPACVPDVMKQLQILSLEIQRMPKGYGMQFENLETLPYLSVCTTSTHDMPPIRMWWGENKEVTQKYYNEILWQKGNAPDKCTDNLCYYILHNHIASKSMLVILPLQDWLSIDPDLRRANADEERINIPANPHHYWRYRMHLNLETLIQNNHFNNRIASLLRENQR